MTPPEIRCLRCGNADGPFDAGDDLWPLCDGCASQTWTLERFEPATT